MEIGKNKHGISVLLTAMQDAIAHGHFLEAITRCQDALVHAPDDPALIWDLGLAYLLNGDEDTAQETWIGAIADLPVEQVPEHLAMLQQLLLEAGDQQLQAHRFESAEAALRQSLELVEAAAGWAQLGMAIAQQGQYEEAVDCWRRSVELEPAQPELYRRWGKTHQELREWREAIACYQQGLAHMPDDAELRHRLGHCLIRVGNLEQAIVELQKAVQLAPGDSAIWGDLGWALVRQTRWAEAIAAWRQMITLQPRFFQDYLHWAEQLRGQKRANALVTGNQKILQKLVDDSAAASEIQTAFVQVFQQRQSEQVSGSTSASSESGDPVPNGYVETTLDWLAHQGLAESHYARVYPASEFTLRSPLTPDLEIHPSFRFGSRITLPASFVSTIPGGRYAIDDTRYVAAITPDNQILGDVSPFSPILSPGHPAAHVSHHPLLHQKKLPPAQKIDGTVAVLAGLSNSVYFHWMLDVLPRWELLRLAGVDLDKVDFFLVEKERPFQRQTLKSLGIPLEKVLTPGDYPHLEARLLLIPSFPASISWMPEWSIEFLRRHFLPPAWLENPPKLHRRLFITRSKASVRRLVNESQVLDALKPWQFEVVDLEDLSVMEQARLFAEAEMVLAVHGSGLTNLVFCQPGTTVVELFSPYYVYPCYWLVANWRQLRYFYLLGQVPEGEFLHQLLYPDSRQEDVWIEPENLNKILEFV
jgi:tetratricopeptide (TPR) repeat protein